MPRFQRGSEIISPSFLSHSLVSMLHGTKGPGMLLPFLSAENCTFKHHTDTFAITLIPYIISYSILKRSVNFCL